MSSLCACWDVEVSQGMKKRPLFKQQYHVFNPYIGSPREITLFLEEVCLWNRGCGRMSAANGLNLCRRERKNLRKVPERVNRKHQDSCTPAHCISSKGLQMFVWMCVCVCSTYLMIISEKIISIHVCWINSSRPLAMEVFSGCFLKVWKLNSHEWNGSPFPDWSRRIFSICPAGV